MKIKIEIIIINIKLLIINQNIFVDKLSNCSNGLDNDNISIDLLLLTIKSSIMNLFFFITEYHLVSMYLMILIYREQVDLVILVLLNSLLTHMHA
jgi:hypothetical protein